MHEELSDKLELPEGEIDSNGLDHLAICGACQKQLLLREAKGQMN